jgi:hypothetical protein
LSRFLHASLGALEVVRLLQPLRTQLLGQPGLAPRNIGCLLHGFCTRPGRGRHCLAVGAGAVRKAVALGAAAPDALGLRSGAAHQGQTGQNVNEAVL